MGGGFNFDEEEEVQEEATCIGVNPLTASRTVAGIEDLLRARERVLQLAEAYQ